jgi:hypothetical protein
MNHLRFTVAFKVKETEKATTFSVERKAKVRIYWCGLVCLI